MGTLYICGTPIGNLEDVSIRLLKTLRKVDLIACEDTRHTVRLLNRYKIKNKLLSYHEHSVKKKEDYIIEELQNGKDIALVSDAGMPVISDPGEKLIRRVMEAGVEIEVIPGPSAFTAALVMSGMDSSSFIFAGFLPNRSTKRVEELEKLNKEKRTVILYEAPHRIIDTLLDIKKVMGKERKVSIARELTKQYQEIKKGSIGEIIDYYEKNKPRGEFSIIIAAEESNEKKASLEEIAAEARELIESGMDKKEAFKMKAREYKISKSTIYKYFIDNMY